jgi:hypothetical protein
MPAELSDARSIVILCLVIGFILSVNLTLFGLLRGDRRIRAEASKWTSALGGGAASQKTQSAQLADLRRAVEQLEAARAKADETAAGPRE